MILRSVHDDFTRESKRRVRAGTTRDGALPRRTSPLLVGTLLGAVLACATPPEQRASTVPRRNPRMQVQALSVEHVPLPSDGLVQLSLWIDGGTLDAEPPASATLAAWLLELESSTAGGREAGETAERLRARATPDGLELSLRGSETELDAMLDRLARALGTRELSAERHAELGARLVDTRRRALASPGRRADELALRGILGAAVFPFEGDPSADDVRRFLDASFGPERALLVVVGELDPARLEASIRRAFASAPAARGLPRRELVPTPSELDRGPVRAISVASAWPSEDHAWAFARALAPESSSVAVFPHRGGASVLARVEPSALPRVVAQARFGAVSPRPLPEAADVAALAERRGLAWLAERHDVSLDRRVAVGALCPEENARGPVDRGANGGGANGVGECEAAVARATRDDDVTPRDGGASAPNGARVLVQAREGALVLALRFATGGQDASAATVIAASLALRCGVEPELEQVTPELDPQGFALVARATDPTRHAEAISALTRCATSSVLRETDRLRLRALDERRMSPERAWLASALAPGATSTVAPRGDLRGLARSLDVRGAARELRVGARTTLAVVGPVPAEEAALLGARLLAALPEGEAAPTPHWGEPTPLVAERFEAPRVRVALGWRTDRGGPGAALVARAFADAIAGALGSEAEVRWRDGGEGPTSGAWAALAFDVPPEHVDAVIARARAARDPSPDALTRAIDRERWAGADARLAALRLARTGSARAVVPSAETVREVLSGLRGGVFVLAVGRSQRAGAWNRR